MTIMRKNDNPKSIMRNEKLKIRMATDLRRISTFGPYFVCNVFLLYLNDFRGIMGVVVFLIVCFVRIISGYV